MYCLRSTDGVRMEHDAVDNYLAQWAVERPDLDVRTMGVMGRLSRFNAIVRADLQRFMNQFGLEPWEFDVLATLRRAGGAGPLTSGHLAAQTMVGSAAMTNRVDRLVGRDLIDRETNPQNRRQLLISLTPQGRQLVDEVVAHHVENQRTMLQALNEREQETLARLLRKFLLSQDDRADEERGS